MNNNYQKYIFKDIIIKKVFIEFKILDLNSKYQLNTSKSSIL
jgi:hypothetical protein